jgi:phenylalanine-4-hydroxylase
LGLDEDDRMTFIKTAGPSALAVDNKQLNGHSKLYHKDGFSSPVGRLKDSRIPLEDFGTAELEAFGLKTGTHAVLLFESGIHVSGVVKYIQKHGNKIILIVFEDCTVKENDGNVLFQPEWGIYDMAVGERIISVFNGAADKEAYEEITHISEKHTEKVVYDEATQKLHHIYKTVRAIRENNEGQEQLPELFDFLKTRYREDWLCALEILEILHYTGTHPQLEKEVRIYLEVKAANEPDHKKLINDGLHVIANPVTQLITEED